MKLLKLIIHFIPLGIISPDNIEKVVNESFVNLILDGLVENPNSVSLKCSFSLNSSIFEKYGS